MNILPLRITAILLLGCFIFGFSGCTPEKNDVASSLPSSSAVDTASSEISSSHTAVNKNSLSLAYACNRTMNPFTADSALNLSLWPLLYDCLSVPSPDYTAQNMLASSISSSGNTVTVRLKSGVRFTDGSLLRSDDVRYSFGLASSGNFSNKVSNIASISVPNQSTVIFTLKTPDPLFANMLYVPIIKSGTGNSAVPMGTGRYVFSQNGINAVLKWNNGWFGHKTPQIKTVSLINIPDDNAVLHSFEIGNIDCLTAGDYSGSAATINADVKDLNVNQLFYIGINESNAALSNFHVRKAISLLVDRKAIAAEVFSSHALASVYPFNPSWKEFPKQTDAQLESNFEEAARELAQAGYTVKNSNGVLAKNETGVKTTLDLTLLVNSENASRLSASQKIANSLKNAGFNITVKQTDYTSYTGALSGGNFDLYLGEIRLSDNLDLSPFFTAGNMAAAGIPATDSFISSYQSWKQGQIKNTKLLSDFLDDSPFIPVCYTFSSFSCRKGFFDNIKTVGNNIFYNIEDWRS